MDCIERYRSLCPEFSIDCSVQGALRVNTLKISDEALLFRLRKKNVSVKKIPFVDHGYWFSSNFSLGSAPEYLQGFYYLQEAASQLPCSVLNPLPSDTVLDLCCAPGGKFTQLSENMKNTGLLVGIDVSEKRLYAVRNNCARLGIKNCVIYCMDARECERLGLVFDKVLIDAPCSGNFVIEKNFFNKRSVRDFENRARMQKEIVRSGFSVLKKNGLLVYSTCSLEPEENEFVIDWAVNELGARVVALSIGIGDCAKTSIFGKSLCSDIVHCKRFWPHKTKTQGFFIAALSK